MRKCRDCSTIFDESQSVLCPRCRVAATEKRKARKRDKANTYYYLLQKPKAIDKPDPPHTNSLRLCLTDGCHNEVEGKFLYCPTCRRTRHLIQQQKYRDRIKALQENMPPEPITNLDWLNSFSDWAKSGLSYAEYQKAEWMKSKR